MIPPEATSEPEVAHDAIGGEEFVFDIQGHLLEYDLNPILNGQDFWDRFPQKNCGEDDPRVCYSIESFLELMFLRSDTSMLVLSALPIYPEGSPMSTEIMDETRRIAEGLCRDERVLEGTDMSARCLETSQFVPPVKFQLTLDASYPADA